MRHMLFPTRLHRMHRTQKRATAITPTNVSGLALWLDLTDTTKLFQDTSAATPVAANNDPIGRINDKSSNANNFTQGTAGRRPLWQSDGNGGLFDGTDDVLAGSTTGLLITSKTIIVAWTPVTFPSSTRVAFGSSSTNYYYVGHTGSTADMRASWFNSTSGQKTQASGAVWTANKHGIFITQFDVSGSSVTTYQRGNNGQNIVRTAYTDGYATPNPPAFFIGALTSAGGNGVNAKIRHVLVYSRVLTPLELAGLETYLTPP